MSHRRSFNMIGSHLYMILSTILLMAAAVIIFSGVLTSFHWLLPVRRISSSTKRSVPKQEFFLTEQDERVKSLHLIGERHSGTRWVYQHLNECFNTSVVTVSDKLTRWKHWFQYEDENQVDAFADLYVIAMFRNPYDWVETMRKVPYHSPRHKNMEWHDFVTTPWTMPRFGRDLKIMREEDNHDENTNGTIRNNDNKKNNKNISNKNSINGDSGSRFCNNDFYYNQVVPCLDDSLVGDMHPLYEHDPLTGRPYPSILQLRRDKIVNFLSVEHYQGVKFFNAHKYEDLLQHGTWQLVEQLEDALGVTATCQPSYPTDSKTKRRRAHAEDYVEWMQKHVDWDTSESLVGYRVSDYV